MKEDSYVEDDNLRSGCDAKEKWKCKSKTVRAFGIMKNSENNILFILNNGQWWLPWWWVEHWESPKDAVEREVDEETWLKVKAKKIFEVYHDTKEYKWHKQDQLIMVYECDEVWWELKTETNETDDARYFPLYDLPGNLTTKDKLVIQDLLQELKDEINKEKK